MPRTPSCSCGTCPKCKHRKVVQASRAYDKKVTTILRKRIARINRSLYPYIEATHGHTGQHRMEPR